jgi:ketosteroid isomerase-like protein
MGIELPQVVADHVEAVNAGDVAAIMQTFSEGAFVNDARREYWGAHEIRGWVEREIVGARVRMDPVEVRTHDDLLVVRARYDGEYDKTGLPPELILTNYVTLERDAIATLIIIHNQEAP